jgi:hypothetical protein
MAVAHRSINWPASVPLPRPGAIRYSGSKANISGQPSLRDSQRQQAQARNLALALSSRARTRVAPVLI